MATFVDTSIWYSAANESDVDRNVARSLLAEHASSLVTSDHVLAELWNLLNARTDFRSANRIVGEIQTGLPRIECTVSEDLQAAEAIRVKFDDQAFSLTDRTSFALMERLGISDALSFDEHYRLYRYGPEGRRAFRVLP
ncbi:MAG: PIN domain-containing protein [Acidimicrobiaceae bacterium]|nr:PIN domain-containing protein [Acidimicrobiaceae bacterium]MDE0319328.1 PIN domain-containing protein [Acidimicrobiaceae bacterium]MDE0499726.1 PIN domain-containing protein [Acidimicrobiaceae bacterium]